LVGKTPEGHDMVLTAHVGEPGGAAVFNNLLREMGVSKTVVVVDTPVGKPLQQIVFDG